MLITQDAIERPRARGRQNLLQELAIAASVANLCFLDAWFMLFSRRPSWYFFKYTPARVDFAAILACVFLATLLFWPIVRMGLRSSSVFIRLLADGLLGLTLLLPLNAVRQLLPGLQTQIVIHGKPKLVLIAVALLIFAPVVYLRWRAPVLRWVLASMFAFGLLMWGRSAWSLVRGTGAEFGPGRAEATRFVADKLNRRAVVLVFDGFDYRLAFVERPPSLQLPQFDRLRSESLEATKAEPPSSATQVSLPALITGMPLTRTAVTRADTLVLYHGEPEQPVNWREADNVFRRARRAGFNTGLVGWYHPYCRMLGQDLTRCDWAAIEAMGSREGSSLPEVMWNQTRRINPFASRLHHIATYRQLAKKGSQLAADGDLGVVYIHLPVPHRPWIYDRRVDSFALTKSMATGYLDNLALADRAIGEIRSAMEAAGVWESSLIIVTGDHWWRESTHYDGKTDHRVPFLVKLPGAQPHARYDTAFNTRIAGDLALAVVKGEVSNQAQVGEWLDRASTGAGALNR